jgi:hypothetical protein
MRRGRGSMPEVCRSHVRTRALMPLCGMSVRGYLLVGPRQRFRLLLLTVRLGALPLTAECDRVATRQLARAATGRG